MIPANQLRLGNKFMGVGMIQTVKEILDYGPTGSIQAKDEKKIEVTEHYSHLILVEENRNQYKPIDMLPIRITGAILIKYGFTQHHGDYANDVILIKMADFKIRYQYKLYPKELGSAEEPKKAKPMEWFHNLQNLYFFITQEELKEVKK